MSLGISSYDNLCGITVKVFPDDIPFIPYVYYHTLRLYSKFIDDVFASDSFRAFPDILTKNYNYVPSSDCINSEDKYYITMTYLYSCFTIFLIGLIISSAFFIAVRFNLSKRVADRIFRTKLKHIEINKFGEFRSIRPMYSSFRPTADSET